MQNATPVPRTTAELTATCRVDPLPDRPGGEPLDVRWAALPGQWDLGLLHRIVREGFAAAVDVGYPDNLGRLVADAVFRGRGTGRATATGTVVAVAGTPAGPAADGSWTVRVRTHGTRPAGLAVLGGDAEVEEVSADERTWTRPELRPGRPRTAPDEVRNPVHPVALAQDADGLWTAPAELLGRVVVRCTGVPRIVAGESRAEALLDPDAGTGAEQRHDLEQRPDGSWASVHELGLRHVAVHATGVESVLLEAAAHPVQARGLFTCSDPVLERIWATSVHTLRVCAQGLLVDGVKRDRMPWTGDTALGAPALAYAFGDTGIARRTLDVLGRHTEGYVNGIVDYSLWWLITHAVLRSFTLDAPADAEEVAAFVADVATEAGPDGVLRPVPGPGAFPKPVFIDWGVDVDPDRDCTALQCLWFWALRSAVTVLRAAGHEAAGRWDELADRLSAALRARAWDAQRRGWKEHLDGPSGISVHATLFAVLSGVSGPAEREGAARTLLDGPATRTPFVTAFALAALAEVGHGPEAVARVRRHWGAMLEAGATSFWEEFADPRASPWSMYGRPFGKSLCHAWAAGPASLLPQVVTGVRPASAGWATFTVDPQLGELEWAGAVVPVGDGEIRVLVRPGTVEVAVPAGRTLVRAGQEFTGPRTVTFPER
ncbi:family 78 glycoside hydrolase catalytic domain [Kineococcus rhizosphaerae]|uniref:Alpha-L-rhamnosidase-like protein n=1 Tax=Kineococcus rhizosphaerae TaxID=559628 RepID=A0A2T0RB70_9ACTN|nr:family 78 glycoside hydrolase catalytic domain [Kineococcus rhizosphaerae]PRY18381.1 alpha-L-rhamnosidase-like protein [Kineococcus rhizosphaerae]